MFSHQNTITGKINKQKKFFVYLRFVMISVFGIFLSLTSTTYGATSVGNTSTDVVPNGLVGHWTFDGKDMTIATATDLSGQGNNGTLTNMTAWGAATIGKSGQALNFFPGGVDTNAYVNVGDPASGILDFGTGDFSVSFWTKFNGYTNQGSSVNCFVCKQITNSPSLGFLIFPGGTSISFKVSDMGSTNVATVTHTQNIADNKWHHIAAVKSGATINVAVDGVFTTPVSSALVGSISNPSPLVVGDTSDLNGQRSINGSMDDVRIYNRALTQLEVQTLYKAGGGVVTAAAPNPLTNAALGINSGLVGYWNFDGKNMTNATATDMSGQGNNGALNNMTASSSATIGKVGQALNFDGVDDYVQTGLTTLSSKITFSAWIYPRSLGEGSLGRIIDKRENGGIEAIYFALNGSNRLIFGRPHSVSTNTNWLTPVSSITMNVWNHVLVTYDDSSTTNDPVMYINGIPQTLTESQTPVGTPRTNADRYIIGNRGDTTRTFDGKIDDVRIYNRILTPAEVQTLYKLGQVATAVNPVNTGSGLNSGLAGYWNFDGKNMTNTTALDISGNGNTGTLTNITTRGNAVPGKIGQGLRFSGSGYIDLGTPATLNMSGAHSLSVWVKTTAVNTTQTIFAGGTQGCCGTEYQLNLNFNGGGGTYRPQIFHSSNGYLDANPPNIVANRWYHVVATWNGTTTRKIYVDGELSSSNSMTSISNAFGDKAIIGAADGGSVPLYGILDELRVYSREVSAEEVKQLYKLGTI